MNSNMINSLERLTQYLSSNHLQKTLQTLRIQLLRKIPQEPSNQLLSILKSSEKSDQAPKFSKKTIKPLNNNEVQNIMHKLVNRMAGNSKIINDPETNNKIQKMMNQKVFQRLVQNTSIFDGKSEINISKSNTVNFQDELDFVLPPQKYQPKIQIPIQHGLQFMPKKQRDPNDKYLSDEDYGYQIHRFLESEMKKINCGQIGLLAIQIQMPKQIVQKLQPYSPPTIKKLPDYLKNPVPPTDSNYPISCDGTVYSCMNLKVIYNRQKTGYEQNRQFPIIINDVIGGRYQILDKLGSGAFASAVEVKDLKQNGKISCLKIFSQHKEAMDQGFDQIRLLKLINANCNPDQKYLLKFYSSFYHKQHLFIETELLGQDLLVTYQDHPQFFTIPILKQTAKMLLMGLDQLHKMHIIHCDLKPQNILVKSFQPYEIKIVDLGNASFFHDDFHHLYMQSRNYRAPELLLGIAPTGKIDIWSLGCILAQLWLKKVLFRGQVPEMLAKIQGVLGPWPSWMLQYDRKKPVAQEIRFTHNCSRKFVYHHNEISREELHKTNNNRQKQTVFNHFSGSQYISNDKSVSVIDILIPKNSSLSQRIRSQDPDFVSFLEYILRVDPTTRPTAEQALKHKFLDNVILRSR